MPGFKYWMKEGQLKYMSFLSDFHVVKFQFDAKWRASHPRSVSRGVLSLCLPRAKDAPSRWALSRDSRQNPRASFGVLQTKAAVNSAEDSLLSPTGSPRSPAKTTAWHVQGYSSMADGSQTPQSFSPEVIPKEGCGKWDTTCQCPSCAGKGHRGPEG